MVEEAAAVSTRVQRPAERVLDQSRLDAACWELPQLLHPQTVALWCATGIQRVTLDELFREAAAGSLGDDRDRRANLRSGREVGAGLTVLLQAHIAELHAGY